MEHFSVGIITVAAAILFPLLYLGAYQLRRLGAWSKRSEAPKDRVGFFISMLAILGFVAGGVLQSVIDTNVACTNTGQSFVSCLLKGR